MQPAVDLAEGFEILITIVFGRLGWVDVSKYLAPLSVGLVSLALEIGRAHV